MTIEKIAEELGITEYELWCHDLAEYACQWIVPCQNKIVAHAREIYEDKTLKEMISTYAKAKRSVKKSGYNEFIKACIGDDIKEVSDYSTLDKDRATAYEQVLHDLVWARYCHNY